MKKKSVVRFAGNSIILGAAVLFVFATSSCKKEESLRPVSNQENVAGMPKSAEGSAYQVHQPISLNGVHDVTISNYEINGGAASCIDLSNCYNIHITNCKLVNSDKLGINLANCKNIIIDKCSVANVSVGVYSFNGVDIQVRDNQIAHLTGKDQFSVDFYNEDLPAGDAQSNVAVNNTINQ